MLKFNNVNILISCHIFVALSNYSPFIVPFSILPSVRHAFSFMHMQKSCICFFFVPAASLLVVPFFGCVARMYIASYRNWKKFISSFVQHPTCTFVIFCFLFIYFTSLFTSSPIFIFYFYFFALQFIRVCLYVWNCLHETPMHGVLLCCFVDGITQVSFLLYMQFCFRIWIHE